ncbi:M48 family metallopeptidase [Patescibacteria group bacterium]|nr:M48 family metallopeptidase [Patescibacteria group bacterium]
MYSAISANKRRTWVLIFLMSAFIITLFAVLGTAYGIDAGAAIVLGTMFSTIYTLFSYYASDSVALMTAGAKRIEKKDAPEIWNLVENLCIANGQPMPAVYIINDDSPNAFATGRDPKHASIAFTTGILRILEKQELEGVIAHELSHIKNYDIRVMTIVVVLVGAVTLAADIFLRGSLFGGDNRRGNNLPLILIGLALAILSPLFAELIKLAVSRQREFLADASGALLTRYPEGLASALEKIASVGKPLKNANHATAHLYISNPFKKKGTFQKMFSTHPPTEERVKRLRSIGA